MSQLRRLTNEEAEHKREILDRGNPAPYDFRKEQEEYYLLHPILRDFHELMEG